jgi:hypothetical protein
LTNPFKRLADRLNNKIVCKIEDSFDLGEKEEWLKQKKSMELRNRLTIVQEELRKQMYTFISSALGFVAALFWRDALVQMLKEFLPYTQEWFPKLITAIIVSVLAVVGIMLINEALIKRKCNK